MMHVLMVGGGSAGHLAPMVAVAEALKTLQSDAALSFVCSTKASDAAFLQMEGYASQSLVYPKRSIMLPFTLLTEFFAALRILKKEQPDVVYSEGGAVSIPLCAAAWCKRIPIVLHEPNDVMGRANKIVATFASQILFGKDVGTPIRARITQGKKEEGLRIAGFSGKKPVLLVMGGSQGAQAINEAIARSLDALLQHVDIIHLTGTAKGVAAARPGYFATEFGSDVLPHFYATSDLAVSRAGASSIAELALNNIAMILVPIRGLADDHQVKNATLADEAGAAIALPQEQLDTKLLPLIQSLLGDSVRLQTLRERARYAAKPEAARLIAQTVVQSVARKGAAQ